MDDQLEQIQKFEGCAYGSVSRQLAQKFETFGGTFWEVTLDFLLRSGFAWSEYYRVRSIMDGDFRRNDDDDEDDDSECER